MPKILRIFEDIEPVPGIALNRSKKIFVPLGLPAALAPKPTLGHILILSTDKCRYLWIHVLQSDVSTTNWYSCIQAVWARLNLDWQNMHSVEPRSHLVCVVAVPNLLYVAWHFLGRPQLLFLRLRTLIKKIRLRVLAGKGTCPGTSLSKRTTDWTGTACCVLH